MEKWELDFSWLKLQHYIKDKFGIGDLPNLDTVLFMIGVQKIGRLKEDYTKEDKLDITTLGMCEVLSQKGYLVENGVDDDGWPQWIEKKPFEPENEIAGQVELKSLVVMYFEGNYNLSEYEQKL